MYLARVYEGLIDGKAYKRRMSDDAGWEYVHSYNKPRHYFTHTVVGETNGGWGGEADLHLSTLNNGHWDQADWQEYQPQD